MSTESDEERTDKAAAPEHGAPARPKKSKVQQDSREEHSTKSPQVEESEVDLVRIFEVVGSALFRVESTIGEATGFALQEAGRFQLVTAAHNVEWNDSQPNTQSGFMQLRAMGQGMPLCPKAPFEGSSVNSRIVDLLSLFLLL